MEDAGFIARLEREKRASVVQLMTRCARLLNEEALQRLNATRPDETRVRWAHLSLFAHIDHEGTRITEIARRAGVSKQAIAPLVSELVAHGTLTRVPDPEDGRARLVVFTEQGRRDMMDGLGLLLRFETEVAALLGEDTFESLHTSLLRLDDALSSGASWGSGDGGPTGE